AGRPTTARPGRRSRRGGPWRRSARPSWAGVQQPRPRLGYLRQPGLLGGPHAHVVAAARPDVAPQLATERLHVGHELPGLAVRQLAAERRHPVGPALDDTLVNRRREAA